MARTYFYTWTAKIQRQSLPSLQRLAADMGYIVDTPGTYHNQPSAPQLLDALAAAYDADPAGVVEGLRRLGIGANKNM